MAYRTTKNPRIAFVPSDAVLALLTDLSESSGRSKASLVAELMHDLAPVIKGQVDAHRKLAARPEEARQHVQDLLDDTNAQLAQVQLELNEPRQPRKRKGPANGTP